MPTSLPFDLAAIHHRMPPWLRQATAAQRAVLKARLRQSHRAARRLENVMDGIPPVDGFSRPLLREALARWYPQHTLPSLDEAQVRGRTIAYSRPMSWLEAALQNLGADTPVALYASIDATEPMALDSALFVRGVRNLDLGQRYQHALGDIVDNDHFRELLREQDHAAFAAELSVARLGGHLDDQGERLGEAALAGAGEMPMPDGSTRQLHCGYLSLLGFALGGPLLVRLEPRGQAEPCLLYLPGDSEGAIRQYRSLQAAGAALARRLWTPEFRQFFKRYVSHAEQPAFAARLREILYPRYPYAQLHPQAPVLKKGETFSWIKRLFPSPHDLWQHTLDQNARLPMQLTPWTGECFAARARIQVQRTLSDAASVAVPVARLDAAQRQARILGWLDVGLSVLNVASFFVPALGELMLVVGGAQIVDEFLEGVHALDEGETDAAIAHLFEVFENLLQFAALGAVHGAIEAPGPLQDWVSIPGQAGRLWHGDLTPFSREPPWPAGTRASANGLHRWQGRYWLELEGKAMPVERAEDGRWHLAAAKGHRHQPALLGNDEVAWRLEHEQPLAWGTAKLLRRLGAARANVTDATLLRALRCTGHGEAALRRVMVDQRPAPALLLDSMQALDATQLGAVAPADDSAAVLARHFPALSPRVQSEILAQAGGKDLARLRDSGRLPLAMAETARLYLREARLNRALQGFYQMQGAAHDRDMLVFSNLQALPGWTGTVRIELREGRPTGTLLAAAGGEGLPVKTVVRTEQGYRPHDERGEPLAGTLEVFQALLNAMPDGMRRAIGLQIHDAPGLRDALFDLAASDRQRSARQLRMAPLRSMFRLPTRALDDSRIGYRLSGRGAGWIGEDELFDSLFPGLQPIERGLLRERLRQQARDSGATFGSTLERLRDARQRLDATLDGWISDTAGIAEQEARPRRNARMRAARAIREAWRRESPTPGNGTFDYVHLTLDAANLGALPGLPDPLDHVAHLEINGWQSSAPQNLGPFLRAFPQVQHLDIATNRLDSLPDELTELRALRSLDLSENSLRLDDERTLGILSRLTNLQRLNLTDSIEALPATVLQHLGQLPALYSLQLDLNVLSLETAHFEALRGWSALTHLSLGSNDITLTIESRAALAGLDHLQVLLMEENPLHLSPDLTGWTELRELDLGNTGISEWPQGLQALLEQEPLRLRSLSLNDNHLTSVPPLQTSAFARLLRDDASAVGYNLDGNPWSEAAQRSLADAGLEALPVFEADEPWEQDLPGDLEAHRSATAEDPQWQPLYSLFERLRDTPDYRNNPPRMRARLTQVLRMLAAPAREDGDGLWGQAQVHQQVLDDLNDAAQTCADQASLLFQRIETDVTMWWTASTAEPGANDEAVAVAAVTGLLRQRHLDERVSQLYSARVARRRALADALDETARETAPMLHPDDDLGDARLTEPNYLLDEIEMALYARMQLRERLELPMQPQDILFGSLARLSEATLDRLGHAVLTEVDPQRLAQWASQQRFWQGWTRQLRPAPFAALAREWDAASMYYTELSEAGAGSGAYAGPAVPESYIQALEQRIGPVPGLAWRVDGVLQRIDLVSSRYAGESTVYEQAGRLLLSTRHEAEQALYLQVTEQMIAALPAPRQ